MFFDRQRLKKHTKIILIVMVIVLSASLIMSSIQWSGAPVQELGNTNQQMNPEQTEKFFQEQIDRLNQIVEEDSKNIAALSELAGLYMFTGESEKAIAAYQQLIVLQPDNVDARVTIAYLYFSQQEYTLAEEQVKQALDQQPDNIQARHIYAMILADDKKDYQAAVAEMEKIIELSPDDAGVHERVQEIIDEWKKIM